MLGGFQVKRRQGQVQPALTRPKSVRMESLIKTTEQGDSRKMQQMRMHRLERQMMGKDLKTCPSPQESMGQLQQSEKIKLFRRINA